MKPQLPGPRPDPKLIHNTRTPRSWLGILFALTLTPTLVAPFAHAEPTTQLPTETLEDARLNEVIKLNDQLSFPIYWDVQPGPSQPALPTTILAQLEAIAALDKANGAPPSRKLRDEPKPEAVRNMCEGQFINSGKNIEVPEVLYFGFEGFTRSADPDLTRKAKADFMADWDKKDGSLAKGSPRREIQPMALLADQVARKIGDPKKFDWLHYSESYQDHDQGPVVAMKCIQKLSRLKYRSAAGEYKPVKIVVAGYSYGGSSALAVTRDDYSAFKIQTDLMVVIDPRKKSFSGDKFNMPKPEALKNWVHFWENEESELFEHGGDRVQGLPSTDPRSIQIGKKELDDHGGSSEGHHSILKTPRVLDTIVSQVQALTDSDKR